MVSSTVCLFFIFFPSYTNKAIIDIDEPKSLFNPAGGGGGGVDVYIISDLFVHSIFIANPGWAATAK